MAEKPNIGDIVQTESGKTYPVVGFDQDGRTSKLPMNARGGFRDAVTRGRFNDDLEIKHEHDGMYDAVYQAFMCGFRRGREDVDVEDEVAETVAALATEGLIPEENLPAIHRVAGNETAERVREKMTSSGD